VGLQQIHKWRPEAARILLFLCIAHFAFWYAMHVRDTDDVSLATRPYETWDAINHRNPERRILVNEQLKPMPGQILIFVRYWPQHIFQDEWVYNEADIDGARVVWARDLGEPENEKLRQYYPARSVWLLEADARPPQLVEYKKPEPSPEAAPVATPTSTATPAPTAGTTKGAETVAPPSAAEPKKETTPSHPKSIFEDVPRGKS
jgi:hypothetical protein